MSNVTDIPFTLYTAATPNGHKISIALEELGVKYNVKHVNLASGEQRKAPFLALNPNGRIPVLIDHTNNDLTIFESGSILLYLAEKEHKLLPSDPSQRVRCISWVMWQMSSLGPMQGQANVFLRYASERIPFAINRYQTETKRLYSVLDDHLRQTSSQFIVGNELTIADICIYPWIRVCKWAGLSLDDYAYVKRWCEGLQVRPGFVRGEQVPFINVSKKDLKKAIAEGGARITIGNEGADSKL